MRTLFWPSTVVSARGAGVFSPDRKIGAAGVLAAVTWERSPASGRAPCAAEVFGSDCAFLEDSPADVFATSESERMLTVRTFLGWSLQEVLAGC